MLQIILPIQFAIRVDRCTGQVWYRPTHKALQFSDPTQLLTLSC